MLCLLGTGEELPCLCSLDSCLLQSHEGVPHSAVTEGKNKVNWKCQLVFSFAAEPFKSLETAACAGFIWATIN